MLLHVLHIEDSKEDFLLIQREIKKNDYEIIACRIENAEAMRAALAERTWDLILADYTVPGFGALPALAIIKDSGRDIPFIIVSGTMDEETAVTAMKAGAKDYIMKDNLKRLFPAIARELSEVAERRRQRISEAEALRSALTLTTVAELLPDMFFVTDRQGRYQMINSTFEKYLGKSQQEVLGKTCKDIFPASVAQVLEASDMKTMESGCSSRQEYRLHTPEGWLYIENIKIALRSKVGTIEGMVGLSRNITEQKKAELELQGRLQQLQRAWEQTVLVLSEVSEAKDAYTAGHQRRVARLSSAIGQRMGVNGDTLNGLTLAALIHDIGKLRIPGELLSKPGKLSELEYQLIQTHVEAGYAIVLRADLPWNIAEIIYQHQEREDGSGYPRGLRGKDILPEAKIIAVADVVEAMSNHRPYRPALGVEKALQEIEQYRGIRYDSVVVDTCLTIFKECDLLFF